MWVQTCFLTTTEGILWCCSIKLLRVCFRVSVRMYVFVRMCFRVSVRVYVFVRTFLRVLTPEDGDINDLCRKGFTEIFFFFNGEPWREQFKVWYKPIYLRILVRHRPIGMWTLISYRPINYGLSRGVSRKAHSRHQRRSVKRRQDIILDRCQHINVLSWNVHWLLITRFILVYQIVDLKVHFVCFLFYI